MRKYPWLIHPIFVFIFSLLALGSSLTLYIHWYLEASQKLDQFVAQHGVDPRTLLTSKTWLIILILSILVAIILGGLGLIFSYYQKAIKLYWHQKNFIDGFTHELKTPIASLKLYIDTFLKHELPREEQKKYLGYMQEDTKRLSQNVERVLNLARIESNKTQIDFETRCLEDFILDYISKAKKTYNNVQFQTVHFEQKHSIKINRHFFEMLLSNIVENAIKYNKNETIKIEFKIHRTQKELYLSIKDNGIGIPKNELKKIFNKFYQVGRSDIMTAKGNGLGLNLVQHIAKLHSAKIHAHSTGRDQGSTFSIIFPLKKVVTNG